MTRESNPAAEAPVATTLDGVLVVDKPTGVSSHDIVSWTRRILGIRKIGHIGTLDPMATGVLPLVVGRATRLASLLGIGTKTYEATIRLGLVTDTYDVTGEPVETSSPDAPAVPRASVDAVLVRFVGTYPQTPPPFSAKKIGGVRAYALARKQRPPKLEPVEVTVHAIELTGLEPGRIRCRVTCDPGFYVRSLAHDVGRALGCGATLESLRRVRAGRFGIADAVRPETLEQANSPAARITPLRDLLPDLPAVALTERGLERARHGNPVPLGDCSPPGGVADGGGAPGPLRLLAPDGQLVAIAERRTATVLHPRIVLV